METRMWVAITVVAVVVVGVIGLAILRGMTPAPPELGVRDGRLTDCPASPNCVSSQAADARHRMPPIPYSDTPEAAMRRLEEVIAAIPGMRIVDRQPGYLRAEATSRVFRFVDDVELLVDREAGQIHFRSASRVGYSDLGANRARMRRVRERFESLRP